MNDLSRLTVKEVGERFLDGCRHPGREEIELLERDSRAGVRRIAATLRNRAKREDDERRRIEGMLKRERALWEKGMSYVAGVDEVGMGPFAGPVVAAAVVFSPGVFIPGVKDSKKLDHERRVALDELIRRKALGVGIGLVDVGEIDRINIYEAALKAMRLAIIDTGLRVQQILVDGREIPGIAIPQEALVGGDNRVFSIAAASIVAKVYRDMIMIRYHDLYPHYGFSRNKGYGTAEHRAALRKHGPCELHRRNWGHGRT